MTKQVELSLWSLYVLEQDWGCLNDLQVNKFIVRFQDTFEIVKDIAFNKGVHVS